MYSPCNTDITLTETLQYLVQIQKELRKLLRECAIGEPIPPCHSLYSSKRIFRGDELHLGLHNFGKTSVFSHN